MDAQAANTAHAAEVEARRDGHSPRPGGPGTVRGMLTVDELRRLYGLHDRLFGRTPRSEWLPLEGPLAAEVDERLARLGHASLLDWAGVANLEERVDGTEAVDPVVLEALREQSG